MKIEQVTSLRCSFCGAPLKQPADGSEYVKCDSCGTTTKMVDAKAFLEQIMGHVYGWVRSAIPAGFDFSQAENVDPVARHNIFITNVRPRLSTEFTEYRFNLFNLLSGPLICTPFKCANNGTLNNSNQAFEFNAKNKAITCLAIDPDSKSLVAEVDRCTTTYAYLLNNTKLMRERSPERYALMAANFQQSLQAIKDDKASAPLANRLSGLYAMSTGIDHMLNGRIPEARESYQVSKEQLELAKNSVIGNMNLGIMYQAIEKELLLLTTLDHMLQTMEMDVWGDPLGTIKIFENIIGTASEMEYNVPPRWATSFRDEARLEEILRWVETIRKAQKGTASLSVVAGGGRVLFPFWLVDFRYSFKTGSLWMKKGVEVNDIVLVSAGFPTDPSTLNNPGLALTDIFTNFGGSKMFDSLTGKEVTISNGESLRHLSGSINFQNVSGRYVIPPLSTMKEATILIEHYVQGISHGNSNISEKLKLSAPQIRSLIFIPGDINANGFSINYDFQGLMPRNIGNIGKMSRTIV
jgi:hypothetical protein